MREIGETLADLRKEKGLGQKQLASLLNISVGTVSNYENGVHSPDLLTLCRLAKFFDVTTDYLLGRTDYRCPPEQLDRFITTDYTVQDIVNTILSLDASSQASAISYVKYLKHLHTKSSRQGAYDTRPPV